MSIDPKILETRVIQHEDDWSGISSMARLGRKLLEIQEKYQAADSQSALDGFHREVYLLQLELSKVHSSLQVMDEEISGFESSELRFEEEIRDTRANIQRLEVELQQQQEIRKQRETLEEIAKNVNSRPSRATSKRQIEHVEEELQTVTDTIKQTDGRIQARYKQFESLLQCISDMQGKLVEEEEQQQPAVMDVDADEEEGGNGGSGRDRGGDDDHHEREVEVEAVITEAVGNEDDVEAEVMDEEEAGVQTGVGTEGNSAAVAEGTVSAPVDVDSVAMNVDETI